MDEVLPPKFLAEVVPHLPAGSLGISVVQATGGWASPPGLCLGVLVGASLVANPEQLNKHCEACEAEWEGAPCVCWERHLPSEPTCRANPPPRP